MIKVLDKSFAILEEIIAATPQPLGPLALAKKLGLNRTTCSRILRMLLDAGYIVQVSRQAGYAAGPRIVTLNNMAQYQSRLLAKAAPMVDQLAGTIGDSVLISQVCRGKRYVLYHRNGNPDREIRLNQPAFDDLYCDGALRRHPGECRAVPGVPDAEGCTGRPGENPPGGRISHPRPLAGDLCRAALRQPALSRRTGLLHAGEPVPAGPRTAGVETASRCRIGAFGCVISYQHNRIGGNLSWIVSQKSVPSNRCTPRR